MCKYTEKQRRWNIYRDSILEDTLYKLDIQLDPEQDKILKNRENMITDDSDDDTFDVAIKCFQLISFGLLFNYPIHIKIITPRHTDAKPIWNHLKHFIKLYPNDLEIQEDSYTRQSTLISKKSDIWIKTVTVFREENDDTNHEWLDLAVIYRCPFLDAALNTAVMTLSNQGVCEVYFCKNSSKIILNN